MINTATIVDPQNIKKNPQMDVFWYQIISGEESLGYEDILSVKWTNTLLLGTCQAGAIVVKVSVFVEISLKFPIIGQRLSGNGGLQICFSVPRIL
jgi:hypothetical protein